MTLPPARSAGTRYAKVLPVPVPASATSTSLRSIAPWIAAAISSCSGRRWKRGTAAASGPSGAKIRSSSFFIRSTRIQRAKRRARLLSGVFQRVAGPHPDGEIPPAQRCRQRHARLRAAEHVERLLVEHTVAGAVFHVERAERTVAVDLHAHVDRAFPVVLARQRRVFALELPGGADDLQPVLRDGLRCR